jgi:predicted RNA binding protein YcfA (HicA-like mRNA interferase family)
MPSRERFGIIRKKLEQHGWTLVRIGRSSHYIFKGKGREVLSIPVHGGRWVKPFYVKAIDKAIRELEREEGQGE